MTYTQKQLLQQALKVISLADKRFTARGMEVITLREEYTKELEKLNKMLEKDKSS
jgi:hypothetical protein